MIFNFKFEMNAITFFFIYINNKRFDEWNMLTTLYNNTENQVILLLLIFKTI
jgi:hypothetical protein